MSLCASPLYAVAHSVAGCSPAYTIDSVSPSYRPRSCSSQMSTNGHYIMSPSAPVGIAHGHPLNDSHNNVGLPSIATVLRDAHLGPHFGEPRRHSVLHDAQAQNGAVSSGQSPAPLLQHSYPREPPLPVIQEQPASDIYADRSASMVMRHANPASDDQQYALRVRMHSQHRQQPQVGHESWERPKRRRATTHQLTELEQVFQRTFYPTTAERHELARRLGMTPRRVQIWFQNQRQKIAKKEQDERVVRCSPEADAATLDEQNTASSRQSVLAISSSVDEAPCVTPSDASSPLPSELSAGEANAKSPSIQGQSAAGAHHHADSILRRRSSASETTIGLVERGANAVLFAAPEGLPMRRESLRRKGKRPVTVYRPCFPTTPTQSLNAARVDGHALTVTTSPSASPSPSATRRTTNASLSPAASDPGSINARHHPYVVPRRAHSSLDHGCLTGPPLQGHLRSDDFAGTAVSRPTMPADHLPSRVPPLLHTAAVSSPAATMPSMAAAATVTMMRGEYCQSPRNADAPGAPVWHQVHSSPSRVADELRYPHTSKAHVSSGYAHAAQSLTPHYYAPRTDKRHAENLFAHPAPLQAFHDPLPAHSYSSVAPARAHPSSHDATKYAGPHPMSSTSLQRNYHGHEPHAVQVSSLQPRSYAAPQSALYAGDRAAATCQCADCHADSLGEHPSASEHHVRHHRYTLPGHHAAPYTQSWRAL